MSREPEIIAKSSLAPKRNNTTGNSTISADLRSRELESGKTSIGCLLGMEATQNERYENKR